ncbi:MAG: hypothetical protein AAF600_21550 [Bacteroidota bacterium]
MPYENTITILNPWGYYSRIKGKIKKDKAESVFFWEEVFEVLGSFGYPMYEEYRFKFPNASQDIEEDLNSNTS